MIWPTLVFAILGISLYVYNLKQPGNEATKAIAVGMKIMVRTLPVILVAFLLAGMIEVIIPRAFIENWLSTEAGLRGAFFGTLGGMLLVIGPYAAFPIIASIYAAGGGFATVVTLIFGWCALGLHRIPFESGLLGVRFTLVRLSITFPFVFMAGIIAHAIDLIIH